MSQPAAGQFSGIFISYRRDDSSGHAGRLFDRLSTHFGDEQVFMDIDQIEPGEDFVKAIESAVGSCEVLIALIGRNWLASHDESGRRLDNPNDFVRLEIAIALNRNIRVIPVLVQGADMPRPQELPDDLAKLARRNAFELSDRRWQQDVTELIRVLEKIIFKLLEARQREEQKELRRGEERESKNENRIEQATPLRQRGRAVVQSKILPEGVKPLASSKTESRDKGALLPKHFVPLKMPNIASVLLVVVIVIGLLLSLYTGLQWYQRHNPTPVDVNVQAPRSSDPRPLTGGAVSGISLRVKIVAKGEDVWLRTRIDEQTSSDGILTADHPIELAAENQLLLQYSKSKAQVLEVTINGRRAVVPTSATGRPLLEMLITKDGYERLLK